MKLLMPSHAKKVQAYADPVPLFQRFGVEGQLSAMYQPVVQLRSGGYLVINPTEALVSIDINSGRSTREHNIEETALKTNLEAAHEIRSEEHTSELQSLMRISYAVFCLKNKINSINHNISLKLTTTDTNAI